MEKHGRHGGGRLFVLYGHEEVLWKSFSLKPLVRFWNNFTGLFIVWPFSKIVFEILIRRKTWPPWGWGSLCSSPEHNMLTLSYFDRSMSGIHPSVRVSVREQLLKKSSPLKLTYRFQWKFTEMMLGWCTFRKLQRYEFCKELWLPWQPKEKTLKILLSQTVRARAFIFGM